MKGREISVLDYGCGNVGSLVNIFRHIGAEVRVAKRPEDIGRDVALVLPGVGHFGRAAENLTQSGFADVIVDCVGAGAPLLGVCVGMQLLFDHSSEGDAAGLSLIKGEVRHFDRSRFAKRVPLPNVGWRYADPRNDFGSGLLSNMPRRPRFYFAHSYHAECSDPADVAMETEYGYRFACAVARGSVMGFQFHPEKSHAFGMTLLSNWMKLVND